MVPQLAPSEIIVPAALEPAPRLLGNTGVRPCSVLLIENDVQAVAEVFAALETGAFRIEITSTDSAAAALVDDRVVDIILLSLSSMDGIRTMLDLKRGTDTPLVALIGGRDFFQTNYQLRMATAAGVDGIVTKPAAPERLRVVMDLALRHAACA
jgi:DNA-binding response OmpR family regulator